MSYPENTRVTDAIAKNIGIRWCSSCQHDKPEAGFKKMNGRWVCPGCQARRKAGSRAAS
jgi:formylmethanofuran dehydrogenase subunit E